jgi:hypothetical protein
LRSGGGRTGNQHKINMLCPWWELLEIGPFFKKYASAR